MSYEGESEEGSELVMGPDGQYKKKRAKRRSKNDLHGRDFKCSFCAKTYLSYPALYTHMKTKHSTGPDGQQLLLNSGRGRGRPKKNAGRVTTINPESEDYFKTLDKGGGPTDVLFSFSEAIDAVFRDYWEIDELYGSAYFDARGIEKHEKGEVKVD